MILRTEQETVALGAELASRLKRGDVVALSGGLGVGKTTLVRAILASLGHEGEVPSPSFAIVQPYEDLDPPVWHVDLYRIEEPEEMAELGLDSALDEGVILVEWPERAGPAAWPEALRLELAAEPDGARRLTVEVPAAWKGRWPPR